MFGLWQSQVRYFPGWRKACQSPRILKGNPTDEWSEDISQLPPDMQRLWLETREVAANYYGPNFANYASGTAWHAVLGRMYPQTPNPSVLREPKNLIVLARMIEYVSVENAPQLTVVRFGPNVNVEQNMPEDGPIRIHHVAEEPDLMWEHDQKYLLAMPGYLLPNDTRTPKAGSKAYKQFKTWSKQKPAYERNLDIPAYELWPLGPADTVVYRSTKWTDKRDNQKGAQEYIHQFGPDVVANMAPGEEAFVFEGGKLDMVAAGIIN